MANSNKVDLAYFNKITDADINRELAFLKHKLPRKCTKNNYQLSEKLLKINRSDIYSNKLQDNLQIVADNMRLHLQIKRPIKILTMSNVEAGKFERIDNLNCIYINGDLKTQNYLQKIAILAHEMSHYFLIYQHGIHLPKIEQNELLTELNAIYTGFGLLLLEGYKTYESREGNRVSSSKVGYINTYIVKKAIVKTAYLRKQDPKWLLKNVGTENLIHFIIKLFPLIKVYIKIKIKKYRK